MTGIDPSPMGRGYSAYEQTYKSAPGRETAFVGYDYSADANEAVLHDLRRAAKDLVGKLDEKILFKAERLSLSPPETTPFYMAFDHILRDELHLHGYRVENAPASDVLALMFSAQDVVTQDAAYEISSKPGKVSLERQDRHDYQDMVLSLVVGNPKEPGSFLISGIYNVPTYGFKPLSGAPKQVPLNKVEIPIDSYNK